MAFQSYLDSIEDKTGLTPRALVAIAHGKGFTDPGTKAGVITHPGAVHWRPRRPISWTPVHRRQGV